MKMQTLVVERFAHYRQAGLPAELSLDLSRRFASSLGVKIEMEKRLEAVNGIIDGLARVESEEFFSDDNGWQFLLIWYCSKR